MERCVGASEFTKHSKGNRLTMLEAIKAKCFDCSGFYDDGKEDCGCTDCPLHPYMPYNKKKVVKRIMSESHKKKIKEALDKRWKKK